MANIYSSDKYGYVCELWGSSTKHPDSVFHFSNFKTVEFIPKQLQVYQWLLECASKLEFPFFAKQLVDEANENYYIWNKSYYMVHIFTEDGDAESGPHCSEDVQLILANNENEAKQLVLDGYYMKDEFIVGKYEDPFDNDEELKYDGITVEQLDYDSDTVKNWFEDYNMEIPFN